MRQNKYTLLPYILKYKWHYAIGVFVLMMVDLANLYIPQFIGEIIDGITSGILDIIGDLLSKPLSVIGFPAQLVPLSLVKMFSSSAATGLLLDVFKKFGTDSEIGRASCRERV